VDSDRLMRERRGRSAMEEARASASCEARIAVLGCIQLHSIDLGVSQVPHT
jgi:hypothetical protein